MDRNEQMEELSAWLDGYLEALGGVENLQSHNAQDLVNKIRLIAGRDAMAKAETPPGVEEMLEMSRRISEKNPSPLAWPEVPGPYGPVYSTSADIDTLSPALKGDDPIDFQLEMDLKWAGPDHDGPA